MVLASTSEEPELRLLKGSTFESATDFYGYVCSYANKKNFTVHQEHHQ
jgi:hypothetical protein